MQAHFCLLANQVGNYTLEDLKLLSERNEFSEFFEHAKDLRPSQRKKTWQNLVIKTARNFFKSENDKALFSNENLKLSSKIIQWDVISSSEFAQLDYEKYLVSEFKKCHKSQKDCSKIFHSIWIMTEKKPELNYLLLSTMVNNDSNVSFKKELLKETLKNDTKNFYCKKELIIRLIQDFIAEEFEIAPLCAKELSHQLITIHKNIPPSPEVYLFIKQYVSIEEEDKDFWLTYFYLSKTNHSKIFTESWSHLSKIAKNLRRREQTLNKLKSIDPLPDNIFSEPTLIERKANIKHTTENFPEYLDFYTDQCIEYYVKQKPFKKGNPTVNCKLILEVSMNEKWLPDY